MSEWLLVETFVGSRAETTLIAVGNSPRRMVPLRNLLRGRSLGDIEAAIATVRQTRQPLETVVSGRRVLAHPLSTFAGHLNGIWIWTGAASADIPPRGAAGAWQIDLESDTISASAELFDFYRVPPAARRTRRSLAEGFIRLVISADEPAVLAAIVQRRPGQTHQTTWTVRLDDGELRAAQIAYRIVEDEAASGEIRPVLLGITQDIGPIANNAGAVAPAGMAQKVLDGLAEPGQYRAIVDLRTLRLLRWVEGAKPPTDIAWGHDPTNSAAHWIHPDDLGLAKELTAGLDHHGRAESALRFRTTNGTWRRVPVTAHLIELDPSTNAALLTLDLQEQLEGARR
jgi:hypothetical protein